MRKGYATQGAVQPGPVFLEDAKGNRYDVAGNIVPPVQDPVTDALSVARREVVDPYAEEIASAKKLMADKAYQEQSWGDWASNAGKNLYETGMSFLPTALGGRGEVGLTDIAKGAYESAKSGATLPGDVLTGKTNVFDPTSGDLTDEVLRRGADFTGFVTLGSGAIPAEANTLRMGIKGPSVPDDPEDAALKAAQEAIGEDQASLAAKTAQEQRIDDQMEAAQPPSVPPAVSPDAPTKAFVQYGKPIPPSAPPPDPALLQTAQADTRMGADIVKRRLPIIVPEQERVVGGVYTPGAPDGRRWSELTPEELSVRGTGAGFTNDDLQNIWNQTLSEVSEAGRQAVANTGATWKAFPAEQWDKALKLPLRSQLWYELSGEAFVDRLPDLKYNEHMMFLDLVGATSARARPGENLERALAVLSQRLRGVPVDVDVTIPSTVSAALRRDGRNVSSDLANKTGMFSDTLALTGGIPTRYPISVNDVWVGKAFGITDDQLSGNQALHEVFGKYTNKLRDLVNETSPSPYPHQSWNLQSRQWVELRAADEGLDTSVGSTVEGSDYAGEWDKILQKLQKAGIDVPEGKITRDVLMDPRFADALRSTTPAFRAAPKATVEFGTLLTPNGQKAASIYDRARQVGDQNTQDEYLAALTTSMYGTARGKPTLWETTARTALGDTTSVTRIYSPTRDDPFAISGTFGGAAAPNIRVPLRDLTPDQIAYFNAVAGKGLRQKAMAAVEITRLDPDQALPEGAVLSRAVRFDFDGPVPQKMLTDFASALGEGFEISAMRYPDGMVFDINPRFGDAGPEAPSIKAVDNAIDTIRSSYGIENPEVFDISYKSEYGKNYVEDPGDGSGYQQIINDTIKGWEADAVAQLRTITEGKISDAVLKRYLKGNDAALKDAAKQGGFPVSGYTGKAKTVRKVFQQRLSDHASVAAQWDQVGKEIDDKLGALIPKWERRYAQAEKKSIKEAPQRATEQGFTTEAYRGSNRDIQEYGPRASESGYYGGKPTYFTSSPEDATGYTRIPLEEYEVSPYDQLKVLQETNPEATLQDVLGGKYPGLAEEYVNRLAGGENLGAVYPSKLKMQNPVRVGGEGETVFKGEEAANLVKTTANTLAEAGVSPEAALPILSKLDDMLQSGGFGAMDFDLAVREAAKGADKRLLAKIGSILADVYQKAGFDSIDLDASVFSSRRAGSYSYPAPEGSRHYMVFDPENIRGRFAKFGGYGPEGPAYMKAMGGAIGDEDIDNALRLARDVGGATNKNPPVFLTDAQGRQYDAQGNPIQPAQTQAQSNSAATQAAPTPEQVGRRAAEDPATFDAMMERYAVPDRDIADYEALQKEVAQQPQQVQQMTHVGAPPMRDIKVDMPLFGGERSVGQAPYNVANPMSGVAQTAYDLKTVPLYFTPWTAPIGAGLDVAEGVATGDPTTASLAIGFGPGGKMAKAAGIGAANYFIEPSEAEAGPARWFSKAMEVANAIPMNKMTGEQALAMLRKGTSPEELRWTGTDVFLQNKPTVTKDELVDYLNKNRVQVGEVRLGGEKPKEINYLDQVDKDILDRYEPQFKAAEQNHNKALDYFHSVFGSEAEESAWKGVQAAKRVQTELQLAAMREMKDRVGTYVQPKYESYSTPGGGGYAETLYTLGARKKPKVEQRNRMFYLVDENGNTLRNQSGGEYSYYTENDAQRAAGSIYRESGKYKSSHWDDPDVLAHSRSQTLVYDPPGADRPYRVHNVDETQSDWGQEGRRLGFKDQEAMAKVARLRQETQELQVKLKNEGIRLHNEHAERIAPYVDARNRYENELREKYRKGEISLGEMNRLAENYQGPEPEFTGQYRAAAYETLEPLRKKITENEAEIERLGKTFGPISPAPYVGSTEGWTDLAIKKQLDKALDDNADYFSWTPGQAHAERYDLSKHIGKVEYNPDTGSFLAYDPKGKMVLNESVNDPSELEQYVGKELADKIKAEEDSRRASIYDAYSVEKDDEGMWQVYQYGEPMYEYGGTPMSFSSKGDARDYINELQANDFSENPVRLEGLDLRTGGEGMIGYYDKVYLKRVQEVIKKATGTKPEIEVIEVQTADGPRKQLGVKLTDEMREKARFSDFNNGGRVTGGNAYDNDKTVDNALALTREY